MANAIKDVTSEEMGLKYTSKGFEVPRSTLKNKVNSKETDIEKPILLSGDRAEMFWANNKKY